MLEHVWDLLYPRKCGLCGLTGPDAICETCWQGFEPLDSCFRPGDGAVSRLACVFKYEDRAAQAVRRLKYARITSVADPLADSMARLFESLDASEFDLIVPIPIHWRRRAFRGFNQAELLAARLPQERLAPKALKRVRWTRPQVGLDREARMRNLIGAFRASPLVAGKSVLLIDDVTTTGHTSEQCAVALLDKGATQVGLLALTGDVVKPQ